MAKPKIKEKLTLKPEEAAEALNVSFHDFLKLCEIDDFPLIRIGKAVLVPKKALEEWLRKQACRGFNVLKEVNERE